MKIKIRTDKNAEIQTNSWRRNEMPAYTSLACGLTVCHNRRAVGSLFSLEFTYHVVCGIYLVKDFYIPAYLLCIQERQY